MSDKIEVSREWLEGLVLASETALGNQKETNPFLTYLAGYITSAKSLLTKIGNSD